MSDSTDKKMRLERINRLFKELRYEIERGFMEGEIDESIGYRFVVPISRQIKNGIVVCEFRSRPVHRDSEFNGGFDQEPRLKLVE